MSTPEPRTETAERDESRHDTRDDARPASEAPRPAHDEARADERPAMNRDGVPLARVRRAPRVMPFLLTGAVIGALAGLFVSLDGGDGGNYTASSSTGPVRNMRPWEETTPGACAARRGVPAEPSRNDP